MFYVTAARLSILLMAIGLSPGTNIPPCYGYTKAEVDVVAHVLYGEGVHLVDQPLPASFAVAHAMLNGQKVWGGSLQLLAETRWHGYDPDADVPAWAYEYADFALALYYIGYDFADGAVFVLSWNDLHDHGKLEEAKNACFSFRDGIWGLYGFRKDDWPL